MSFGELTYQIAVKSESVQTKDLLISWLLQQDIQFVEGAVEGLDIDYNYEDREKLEHLYDELSLGSVVSIYKYDAQAVDELKSLLASEFGSQITINTTATATTLWTEGWKESFVPVQTQHFYVCAPWHEQKVIAEHLSIIIEPAMAFGTGNHATTKLCLRLIENWFFDQMQEKVDPKLKVLDVGTGSGILAIACKKIGIENVFATDIDPDSVAATEANAILNSTSVYAKLGSVLTPAEFDTQGNNVEGLYDVIIANILFPVLERLMPEFVQNLVEGGLLIVSGLITEDETNMLELASRYNLGQAIVLRESDWIAIRFIKNGEA
ncbi:MAG: 50S ribosomal protein L11 methyltransferase [Oligoflexales bacterium]|nr:50S ribosomal protein L11 methyltransferase [Oligoflexales bacterium]